MNSLILLGNGFDLSHGLPTSYGQFVQNLIEKQLANQNEKKELLEIPTIYSHDSYEKFITDMSSGTIYQQSRIAPHNNRGILKNKFLYLLIKEKLQHNSWYDIEQTYYTYLTEKGGTHHFPNRKDLNKNFDQIKSYLSEHLIEIEKKAQKIEHYNWFFNEISSHADRTYILNFNYTNTFQLYSKDNPKVITSHIHGELNNEQNPMIFGYAATIQEEQELLAKKNDEYLKNIKRFNYKRTNEYNTLVNYLTTAEDITVFIIGHSCGYSDRQILSQVFDEENVKKIVLFHHDGYKSYFESVLNIGRVIENYSNLEKIVSFEDSPKTPQSKDKKEQIDNFKKFVSEGLFNNVYFSDY